MPSIFEALKDYLPDKAVLDQRPPFDDDLSQPLFHKGSEIGCITLHGIGGTPARLNIKISSAIALSGEFMAGKPTHAPSPAAGQGATLPASRQSRTRTWKRGSDAVKYCAPWSKVASPKAVASRRVAMRPPAPRPLSRSVTWQPA